MPSAVAVAVRRGFYYGGEAGRVAGQSEIKCLDDWVGHYNKSAEKLKPARGDGDGLEERGEARVRRRGFVLYLVTTRHGALVAAQPSLCKRRP